MKRVSLFRPTGTRWHGSSWIKAALLVFLSQDLLSPFAVVRLARIFPPKRFSTYMVQD